MPARVEFRLCPVVAVRRPHRPDDRQLVHVARDVRKPVAHLDTALAVSPEPDLKRVELVALVAVGVGHDETLDRQLGGVLHLGERCVGDRLAGVLVEHRLGVEALHVADTTVHEQPDDALRARRGVRPAIGRSPGDLLRVAIAVEQRPECQAGESQSDVREERAALVPGVVRW